MNFEEELKKLDETGEADSAEEEAGNLALDLHRWLADRNVHNSTVILAISKIYAAICQIEGVPKEVSIALAGLGVRANWREDFPDVKPN